MPVYLVGTLAFYPARLEDVGPQKGRWVHGISFQRWDRHGWSKGVPDLWMALRDRRGPLATLVLACGYTLVVIEGLLGSAWLLGAQPQLAVRSEEHTSELQSLMRISYAVFCLKKKRKSIMTISMTT